MNFRGKSLPICRIQRPGTVIEIASEVLYTVLCLVKLKYSPLIMAAFDCNANLHRDLKSIKSNTIDYLYCIGDLIRRVFVVETDEICGRGEVIPLIKTILCIKKNSWRLVSTIIEKLLSFSRFHNICAVKKLKNWFLNTYFFYTCSPVNFRLLIFA